VPQSVGRRKDPGGRATTALDPAALWSLGLRFVSPLGMAAIEDDAHVGAPRIQVREQIEEPPPQRTGDDQLLDDRLLDEQLFDDRLSLSLLRASRQPARARQPDARRFSWSLLAYEGAS
jgi:hypothetical protein